MIGSSADRARSWRQSSKPPSGSSASEMSMIAEIRQASAERLHRGWAVAISANGVALARERGGVVVPNGRFVFDDCDELLHGSQGYSLSQLT